MKIHFTHSEFCITTDAIPVEIADKILKYHIIPMSAAREELGFPINVSKKSGWRPRRYELSKERSGNSEHTFLPTPKDKKGWGAADYTANDLDKLVELMIKHTDYTRICVYPNNHFVHGDYAFPERGRRLFKASSPSSAWKFQRDI